MRARNGRTSERCDGSPWLISGDAEAVFRPSPQLGDSRWRAHKAKIQLVLIHWSLAGVTFPKKLQDNASAEISRQRDVGLQRHAFTRRFWEQIA